MRMWIGTAHLLTFVLKYLHPAILFPKLFDLLHPELHYLFDSTQFQFRKCQIVTLRKTKHTAVSGNSLSLKKRWFTFHKFCFMKQSRKIILKNIRTSVIRILFSYCTFISRTKIALRIMVGEFCNLRRMPITLPGSFGSLR